MIAIAPFRPLAWQVEPWRNWQSPTILLTGSAGGGKSRIAAEKINGFCKRYAGATALVLRKTRASMTNSTVIFLERRVVGRDPTVRHNSSKSRFEYSNGSILAYGGMKDEDQREKIRSIGQDGGVDIVWMEEATLFYEADFDEIQARMRGNAAPWRQIILSTNPGAPAHWIHTRLIKSGEAKVYLSSAVDNIHNPDDYRDTLNRLKGVLRDRLRDGKWVQSEGVVYDEFEATVHVIDSFEIPKEWRRIRVIDFGYTNPFVCQWWAMDPDGRAYLYREIYKTETLVEDHAAEISQLSGGERFEATVCDHDAEGRATLRKYLKCQTVAAHKPIEEGIQKVKSRLARAGDGKVRFYIFRDALVEMDASLREAGKPVSTADEFPVYSWPKSPEGRTVKELPVDKDNHGMDCVRYGTQYLDPTRSKFKRERVGHGRVPAVKLF